MSGKLRIKVGDVEVEYEGPEEFLKKELPELLKTAIELRGTPEPHSPHDGSAGPASGKKLGAVTTNSIAAKLGSKSGPDLLLAAAAQLALVAKTEPFTRQQVLTAMQSATSYYKKNYSGNLSKIIARAIKDQEIAETAKDTYALSAATKADLEARLAHA